MGGVCSANDEDNVVSTASATSVDNLIDYVLNEDDQKLTKHLQELKTLFPESKNVDGLILYLAGQIDNIELTTFFQSDNEVKSMISDLEDMKKNDQIYYYKAGKMSMKLDIVGPISWRQVEQKREDGILSPRTLMSDDKKNWHTLESLDQKLKIGPSESDISSYQYAEVIRS